MAEIQQNNESTETSKNDEATPANKINHYEGFKSAEDVSFTIEEEKKALENIENALEEITSEQWGLIEGDTSGYLTEDSLGRLLTSFENIDIEDIEVKNKLQEKIVELTEKAKGLANNDKPRDAEVRNSYAQALNNIDNSIEDFQKPPTPDQIEAFKEMLVDSELAIASSYYNRVVSILTHDQKEQLLNLYDEISNEENSDTPEELQNKKIILTSINKKIAELAEEYEDNPDELESKIEELFVPTDEIPDNVGDEADLTDVLGIDDLVKEIEGNTQYLKEKFRDSNKIDKGKFIYRLISRTVWFLRLYFTLLEKSGVIGESGSLISKNDPAYKIIAAMVGKKGYAPEFKTGKTDKYGNPIKATFQIDNWDSIVGALEYNDLSIKINTLRNKDKREIYGTPSILGSKETLANIKKYNKEKDAKTAELQYNEEQYRRFFINLMVDYRLLENNEDLDDEAKKDQLEKLNDKLKKLLEDFNDLNKQKEDIDSALLSASS